MLLLRKTDDKIWKPPFSKSTLPPLSTNSPISEQFFHDPIFVQISKTRYLPNPLIVRGEETMISVPKIDISMSKTASINPLHVFSARFCIFERVTRRHDFSHF